MDMNGRQKEGTVRVGIGVEGGINIYNYLLSYCILYSTILTLNSLFFVLSIKQLLSFMLVLSGWAGQGK
jgi:hypothetical protein